MIGRGGFVSVTTGQLTTRPIRATGGDLLLNASGLVTVEVMDAEGAVLASADCRGDGTRQRIQFGERTLQAVAGAGEIAGVRLRFTVADGSRLYAFRIQ